MKYSGEIGNNGYAKFWEVNKVHYGLCENGDKYLFEDVCKGTLKF